jgi:hypothetical protein
MSLLELIPALSSEGGSPARNSPLTMEAGTGQRNGSDSGEQRWRELIDNTLAVWEKNPELLDDEGVDAPSRIIVGQAIVVANYLKEHGVSAPERVVPDGNGGLAFAWFDGAVSESIEINADGSLEYVRIEDHQVVASEPLSLPAHCG